MAARAVDVTAAHGTALPDGLATATFTVDFDAGIPTPSFYLTVNADAALGSLVGSSVTWNGLAVTGPGVPDVFVDPDSGTWGPDYLNGIGLTLGPLPLEGKLQLSYTYELASFAVGQHADVQLYFQYYNEADGSYPETTVTSTLTASAVPEPEAWGLALAGVVVVGAWARRRQA